MKKHLFIFISVCSLLLTVLAACDAREAGSLKSFTKPYIAQYECTDARLGEENLLDKFDYIEIVLADKEKMQLIYKPKNGVKHSFESSYKFDTDTHELTAEFGILGYSFKQSTIVKNGSFTVTKEICGKQLIMNFKIK